MNWTHGRGFITYEVDFGASGAPVARHATLFLLVVSAECAQRQGPNSCHSEGLCLCVLEAPLYVKFAREEIAVLAAPT